MKSLVFLATTAVALVSPRHAITIGRASSADVALRASSADVELLEAVAAFSFTHVGLSAVREPIISALGRTATQLRLVGNRAWRLPAWWQGDASGAELFFADAPTAGRQLFRAGYSLVAGATLAAAAGAFTRAAELGSAPLVAPPAPGSAGEAAAFAVAALAQGVAIGSLANPSPLSLVPAFDPVTGARDDTLKLAPCGLTRITRHPLILPVVPWGIANAWLAGARTCDVALFGGLAMYALVGCYAQDVRAKASAAVGTAFVRGDLTRFYAESSFVPLAAIADGRQAWRDVAREAPWAAIGVGVVVGVVLETGTLGAVRAS